MKAEKGRSRKKASIEVDSTTMTATLLMQGQCRECLCGFLVGAQELRNQQMSSDGYGSQLKDLLQAQAMSYLGM